MTTAVLPDNRSRSADSPAHALVSGLLVQYADDIRATARAFARTAADADDLAQEVSVRALGFAHHFAPGTNFGAWMRTMMRNLAINRGRAAARRPLTGSEASDAALDTAPSRDLRAGTGSSRSVADLRTLGAEREELSAPLLAAVEDLPQPYREVLLLWSLGDQEYREIAATLGIPVGTVMSRLHRARTFLRKRLAGTVDARGMIAR